MKATEHDCSIATRDIVPRQHLQTEAGPSKVREFVSACSIWRALAQVGDVPTLLIIGCAFLGSRRFDEFRRITLLQQTVLSGRLKDLVAAELMRRVAPTSGRKRLEYRLTRAGVDLQQIALLLMSWEERWDPDANALHTISLVHRDCGQQTTAQAHCAACDHSVCHNEVSWENGPGEGLVLAQYPRRRRQSEAVRAHQAHTVFPDRINNIIGDRWSVLILRSMFAGNRRYDDLHRETRAATNILTERLRTLIREGIIRRNDRGDYELTEPGADVLPILALLMHWGDRWRAAPEGPPVILRHNCCGEPLRLSVRCAACAQPLTATNVDVRIDVPRHGG